MRYVLERKGNKIKFSCNNKKIMEDIVDYIQRYMDAQNYREMVHKLSKSAWVLDKNDCGFYKKARAE